MDAQQFKNELMNSSYNVDMQEVVEMKNPDTIDSIEVTLLFGLRHFTEFIPNFWMAKLRFKDFIIFDQKMSDLTPHLHLLEKNAEEGMTGYQLHACKVALEKLFKFHPQTRFYCLETAEELTTEHPQLDEYNIEHRKSLENILKHAIVNEGIDFLHPTEEWVNEFPEAFRKLQYGRTPVSTIITRKTKEEYHAFALKS